MKKNLYVIAALVVLAALIGLFATSVAHASGTCYGPPPIARPGTMAVCVCDRGGFNCHWVLVSTRY